MTFSQSVVQDCKILKHDLIFCGPGEKKWGTYKKLDMLSTFLKHPAKQIIKNKAIVWDIG